MQNEFPTWLIPVLPALKGLGAIFVAIISGGGLYKILDKWMQNRDNSAAREMTQEDLIRTQQQARIVALEEQMIPLVEKAAQLEPCHRRMEELENERDELKAKYEAADIENRRLKTVEMAWEYFKTQPDILRKMADDIENGRILPGATPAVVPPPVIPPPADPPT